MELDISEGNLRRILKVYLELCSYKKIIKSALPDNQKKTVRTGFEQIFEKKKPLKILSSDEKLIPTVSIVLRMRVWAVYGADADKRGDMKQK